MEQVLKQGPPGWDQEQACRKKVCNFQQIFLRSNGHIITGSDIAVAIAGEKVTHCDVLIIRPKADLRVCCVLLGIETTIAASWVA